MAAPASNLTKGEPVTEPKKYVGYKAFARFVSSDDDFLALRRFDRTHCRALLALQDEIHILEERLDALDHSLSTREPVRSNNGTFRNDPCLERKEILAELVSKLGIYGNIHEQIWKRLAISALLIQNQFEPIDTAETQFLNAPDLISLRSRKKAFFRRLLEEHVLARLAQVASFASARISGMRGSQGKHVPDGVTSRPDIPDGGTSWPDVPDGVTPWQGVPGGATSWQDVPDGVISGPDKHIDIAANIFVFFAGVGMLITPLWILPRMGNQLDKKLGTITAFLLLFLIFMKCGTVASPFEVLAATAGYAAVLVVFLQASA
ncbi:hypothetical protein MAPG_04669 [Magnaporthiopsis poae ATCC 64411]|uniref:DUF6594 domain-containing protein n=1 Tax=Magnaporthiopsis poae (strain ATCC 64411 / 73-15) TaxID=644358 RepID=A0A0C4DXC6_MAGP6|nr:hypothetical protein MAPG_04669 [Magnaporthiopsis poae ATCC 64411]